MRVEVAVLSSLSLILFMAGLCARKATLNLSLLCRSELRSCVRVEVAVLSSLSLILFMVGVCGRKATLNLNGPFVCVQSSGVVSKSSRPSWAPRP